MDVQREVDATRREVEMRLDGPEGEQRVVARIARTYPTDVKDLFEACTDADRIARWFAPVTGELRLGGQYQIEGNAGGTITACEPPHAFDATWEFGGQVSWIAVRFTPDGEHARFELTHTAGVDPEFWETYGPGAVGIGWDLGLLGLAAHLGSGVGVSPAEAEAWSVSPEGKAFIAATGHGWAAASVAAGMEPDDAAARAERTIAFYTGG
ncbi:SRPBCC family protein [Actinomycetospora atypica]|uniref:SRPBCC family protein n=1 Tax=Actinomycetospora atypica TaxID=1290095 RepID=A0ABV9YLN2_9PSEU